MSPVNAFHVYFTSGDLSREREKKKRKRKRFIDPNPKRFERARAYFTSRNESRSANFPSDPDPDSRYFFDSRSIEKKKKFTRESFPHIFLEEVIIRIRSTRAITGLFTQLFFLLFHRLHTCKCTIINSRRIDIRCVYIIYNRERKLRLR